MNGADKLAHDRMREERRAALASCEYHLNQVIAHLRYVRHYNEFHSLLLEIPKEEQLIAAMVQCARIHQLDKENIREQNSKHS